MTAAKSDRLFARPQQVVDFAFDDAVADVFPDMIRRSVPGYDALIAYLGVLAQQYAQPHSHVYDLGSSLGAATLAMHRQTRTHQLKHICIDNSEAMVKRSQSSLKRHMPDADLQIICADIETAEFYDASIVVINFTLQFLAPDTRLALLKKVYDGLLPGGVLVLSEKINFDDPLESRLQTDLHHTFKSANGYSELEISQKRSAIENVLIPDTLAVHRARLKEAGFNNAYQWFQSFNFVSLLAQKKLAQK